MIEKLKEQYEKHEDVLFPLLVVIAMDHFFNDGRFKKRITDIVDSILDSLTDRFSKKEQKEKKDGE